MGVSSVGYNPWPMEWTGPQMSIMVIYNSSWSVLIQRIRVMIVRWHSDLLNTKENILPVCDKPYHTNQRRVQKGGKIEDLRNYALTYLLAEYWLYYERLTALFK